MGLNLILLLLCFISLPWAFGAPEGTKYYVKVLRTSFKKQVLIIDRGLEEGLEPGQYAKLFVKDKQIAYLELLKLTPIRSIWKAFKIYDYDIFAKEKYYLLKTVSPYVFTPSLDPQEEKELKILSQDELLNSKTFSSNSYNKRLHFLLGSGTLSENDYKYPASKTSEIKNQRFLFNVNYLHGLEKSPSVYIGFSTFIDSSQASFQLNILRNTTERRTKVGIGPIVTYDFWRYQNHLFSIIEAIYINPIHQLVISQGSQLNSQDSLKFSGLSVSNNLALHYYYLNFFEDFSFLVETNLITTLPHTLTSNDSVNVANYWTDTEFRNSISFELAILFGISRPF